MGFAGGLIATMLATIFKSLMGLEIEPAGYWSGDNKVFFAWLLYSISAILLATGILSGIFIEKTTGKKEGIRKNLMGFIRIHGHSGRLLTDFYEIYKDSIYINMSVLCAFATTLALALGTELNGPVIAGILTMTGFGGLGKHIRNVAPVVFGAVASAFINHQDPAAASNILAILFSSGLAPISGMFGGIWGFIAGFLHVNIALYIGDLNAGLNLYNNGFAASFVVMFLLPIITIFKRDSYFKKDKYR